jgi:hypothetical protein
MSCSQTPVWKFRRKERRRQRVERSGLNVWDRGTATIDAVIARDQTIEMPYYLAPTTA